MKGKKVLALLVFLVFVPLLVTSCSTLKTSTPLVPIKEYDRLLAGSLEADYVGNETCLKACHDHDLFAERLKQSVHGAQKDEGTGMPLVNCESCHGPGSQAIAAEFVEKNKRCDTTQFVPVKRIPAGARSMICLKCHSSHSLSNMQHWPLSGHAQNEVSCSDCHKLHRSPFQKLEGPEITSLCLGCHETIRSRLGLFSRHPLLEKKMNCMTCHEPHGSVNENELKGIDTRAFCAGCHGDKAGPFLFEHGDVNDNCLNCHDPHGSPFASLLRYQEPFLCLQCHPGHNDPNNPLSPSAGFKKAFYSRCTTCHSQIHGTDTAGPHLTSGLIQ